MIDFVGAGPGAADLITVRGMRLLGEADVVIYAGSLINPEILGYVREGAELYNSAEMTLEEILQVMLAAEAAGRRTVRLHTGEPSLYGAVREQMDLLDREGIEYRSCPGVSACFGAASSLNLEFTLPGLSQTLILTRMEGRTPVPESERIRDLAAHRASMAVYLSAGMLDRLSEQLVEGGLDPDTPAVIAFRATWPDERMLFCTVGTLHETGRRNGITKTAVVLVGSAVKPSGYERSRLYDGTFTTGFRRGSGGQI